MILRKETETEATIEQTLDKLVIGYIRMNDTP